MGSVRATEVTGDCEFESMEDGEDRRGRWSWKANLNGRT